MVEAAGITHRSTTTEYDGRDASISDVEGRGKMSANLLWLIAVVVAIIGVIVLISGSVLWGIILLVLAALIGPGGYSFFNRRA